MPRGAIHKLCNAEVEEEGSGQVLPYHFSLIEVNQNSDQKCYMRGRGVKNGPFWRYIIYGQLQKSAESPLLHTTFNARRNGKFVFFKGMIKRFTFGGDMEGGPPPLGKQILPEICIAMKQDFTWEVEDELSKKFSILRSIVNLNQLEKVLTVNHYCQHVFLFFMFV